MLREKLYKQCAVVVHFQHCLFFLLQTLECVLIALVVMAAHASQVWAPTPVSAGSGTSVITVIKVSGCLPPTFPPPPTPH